MCGYICADVNTSQDGPAKVSAKSTELYVIKVDHQLLSCLISDTL